MGDSSPSSTFNLCMFFLSLEIHFLGIYWCFHLIQVIFRIFLSTPFPSWRYSLDFRPLVALETLNALSKFLVNSGYDCWVKKKVFSTNIEKWRVAGFKSERAVGLENLKKKIFKCWRHPMLIKVGTLLYLSLSTCYGVIGQKLTFGIVIWSKISKIQMFTIVIVTPRHTLIYAYQEVFLQWSFRNYYSLRIASKLDEKNRSYTFPKFHISLNWPPCNYTVLWKLDQIQWKL